MARWPAETSAELAVYYVCKMLVHIRTEEIIAIPRKKLAIVHLRFREMIKGRNKESGMTSCLFNEISFVSGSFRAR